MTAAVAHLDLREHAEQASGEEAERIARENEQRVEEGFAHEVRQLLSEFNSSRLGVTIEASAVTRDAVAPFARVTVDGLTFATIRYYDDWVLAVRRECTRGCREALWQRVGFGLPALHGALTSEHTHGHDCLIIYDEDGEATTDREGKLLPAERPPAPIRPTMGERLADVVREIVRDELGSQGDDL